MQPGKTDPDLPLLRAVAAGDAGALNELYQRHGLHILNYLIGQLQDRQLAEDVLHNVMLVMWRKAADFRGDSTVRTWMFGIARLQTLRARQNQHNRITELYDESQPGGDEPPQTVEHLLEHEALEDAIRNLPHSQQQALELVFYRGLSITEAAERLDVPINTLKSRLFRARANLRKLLVE